jgi:asparagine synthase (glutamine-hydrolysing)
MCGIFACETKEHSVPTSIKQSMSLKHRGPDMTTIEIIDDKVFVFHRLSINGLDIGSSQPLHLKNTLLLCNGEIYNYKSLQTKYNLVPTTNTDCEVLLQLYMEKNMIPVGELVAEYAFVLYDKDEDKWIIARDPFGVRPLFFCIDETGYFFASEAKALSHCSSVDPFPPGHCMFIKNGKVELMATHGIPRSNEVPLLDASITLNALLRIAIEERLIGDRPIGCFLSGGLDSSLITAIVASQVKNLHCFSIGLEGSRDVEASRKAVEWIKTYNPTINHTVYTFTVDEGFQAIRDVIWHLETFDITTIRASIPQYLLSKYILENTNIKVLLSGEGSDEIFSGYYYHKFAPTLEDKVKDSERLLRELYLFDNLRVDRTTAAFGLEVRVPYLDTRLVDYVFRLNPSWRMDTLEKSLLRDSFRDDGLLPSEILFREKEAFSDAVSSKDTSWYLSLQGRIEEECGMSEKNYYKYIYNELFHTTHLPHYWMPRWVSNPTQDPSATILHTPDNACV